MFEIRKSFRFESAHKLPQMPEGHKCARLHGHSFMATVVVRGELDQAGLVMDYGEVKTRVQPVIDRLDHQYLNEIPGLENPSSEVLAKWIFDQTKSLIPNLYQIIISETCTSECRYPVKM